MSATGTVNIDYSSYLNCYYDIVNTYKVNMSCTVNPSYYLAPYGGCPDVGAVQVHRVEVCTSDVNGNPIVLGAFEYVYNYNDFIIKAVWF